MEVDKDLLKGVGFDRVTFEVDAEKVDFSKYEYHRSKSGAVSIDESDYIDLEQFRYRLYNTRKSGADILKLEVVLPRIFHNSDHNLYNVKAKKDTKSAIADVLKELKVKGIETSVKALRCVKLEINKTIILDEDTELYKDVFDFLLGRNCSINTQEGLTVSKNFSSNRRKYKFYDKKEELKNTINLYIQENLCRFEISFVGADAITRAFKTTDITAITQGQINKYYKSVIRTLADSLERDVDIDADILYKMFQDARCKKISEYRTVYQKFDDAERVVFADVVYKAFSKSRPDHNRKMDAIKSIIGADSINKFSNYKRAKNLLKKLLKR